MNKKNMSNENLRKVSGGANVLRSDDGEWQVRCRNCQATVDGGFRSIEEAENRIKELHAKGEKCFNCGSDNFEPNGYSPFQEYNITNLCDFFQPYKYRFFLQIRYQKTAFRPFLFAYLFFD